MPYLSPDRKQDIDKGDAPRSSGELNYALTMTVIRYLQKRREMNNGTINYDILDEAAGALILCAGEFRRRVIDKYEDTKIENNGDVYDELLRGDGSQAPTMSYKNTILIMAGVNSPYRLAERALEAETKVEELQEILADVRHAWFAAEAEVEKLREVTDEIAGKLEDHWPEGMSESKAHRYAHQLRDALADQERER